MGIWLQVIGFLFQGGTAAPGVRIWWEGTTIGTISDTGGRFILQVPPRFPAWLRCELSAESLQVESLPDTFLVWEINLPTFQLASQTISAEVEDLQSPQSIPVVSWNRTTLTSAPCCNLSEAFEGTALVDAVFSDGAMGVRQFRLFGFEPAHSSILYENKPLAVGLYRPWAAQFLPTLWVQSLSIAKGVGSVLSGHEGTAGHIQVQYLSSQESSFPRQVEAFARSTGEFFLATRLERLSRRGDRYLLLGNVGWTPFQSHALQDHNADGFLDIPLFRHGHLLVRRLRRDSSGGMSEVDVEGLYEYRWGGQVSFRSKESLEEMKAWGSYQGLGMLQSSLRRGWILSQGRGVSVLIQGRSFWQKLQAGFNRYEAWQPIGWFQLLYSQPLGGDPLWRIHLGVAGRFAWYAETLSTWHGYDTSWYRLEGITGTFAELVWTPSPRFSGVIGGRMDWHSYWGWQPIPRLHLKWQYTTAGALRLSAGRTWRIPDPVAEATSFLMSARLWQLHFGKWPAVERAWSYGFFWNHSFFLGEKWLRCSIDGVRAHLLQPFVWDIEQPWRIHLFSSSKPALYQSLYAEATYEVAEEFRLMLGYKLQEVWWYLQGQWVFRPLLPRHRFVGWLTWVTLSQRWQVDGILSWYGRQRLPSTAENDPLYRLPLSTPAYAILTLQVTHRIDQWEIQIAGENLNGFRQARPVLAADQPFSPQFDASLIWAPIMGRMATLTVRYSW